MLALHWFWGAHPAACDPGMGRRLSASLCAGIGGTAASGAVDDLHYAYRRAGRPTRVAAPFAPARGEDGSLVFLHGAIDNLDALKRALGSEASDPAALYALAVARWGDLADLHVVGDYCSIVVDPSRQRLRLSRSPLRAPPLLYHQDDASVTAGSVPRLFFAAGVPRELNEDRVVDSAMANLADHEATYFAGLFRVPTGSLVHLEHGRPRTLVRYYDPQAIRVREIGDEEAIRRTRELLGEAVRACLEGVKAPAVALSGGLDSPQVAIETLAAIGPDATLPTVTFIPEEGYDGVIEPAFYASEQQFVEDFAARHPRLRPRFTRNEGIDHDHRWNDFFHLMSCAPTGLRNVYVYHGLFREAAAAGCDRLLLADWGNDAFSAKGQWGWVEYFRSGRWGQMVKALRTIPGRRRPLAVRFAAQVLMPFLPDRWWARVRRLVLGAKHSVAERWQPFTQDFRERSGGNRRLAASGPIYGRFQPRSARHARALLARNDDSETAEVYQAFEQMYGITTRDPLAYRPLVEFCWSLPTRMFMRDGQVRWLARELGRGIMSEAQRTNTLNGMWDSDWLLRVRRRREDWLAELERLGEDERFAGRYDIPRLTAALEDLPEVTPTDEQQVATLQFAVPLALMSARFVNWVEGRNQR